MVEVSFADRKCGTPKSLSPNDLVTRVEAIPKEFTKSIVDKIDLDNVAFLSIRDPTPYGSGMFADDENGIAIQTNEKSVQKIYYLPASEDSRLCPGAYVEPTRLFPHVTIWETPCPTIGIDSPEAIQASHKPITIVAQVTGVTPFLLPTYTWRLSAGKIISGQNTDMIKVNIYNLPEGTVLEVKLEVGGFPTVCTRTATAKVFIKKS
jgi:hypothetical protein